MKRFVLGEEVVLKRDFSPLRAGDRGMVFHFEDKQGVRFYRIPLSVIWSRGQEIIDFCEVAPDEAGAEG